MGRSFKEIIADNGAMGSLHDLKKCYTGLDPEIFNNLNLNDDSTCNQQKTSLIVNQYNAMINVYLKNHDEYRSIQAQVYTIITGLLSAAVALTNWTLNGYPYAFFGLLFVCFFSWMIHGPIVSSIHKNRLFHEFSAFYIRAIEDKIGLYNIPLRSREFVPEIYQAQQKRRDYNYLNSSAGSKWISNIEIVFWVISVSLSFLTIIALYIILSQA